MGLWDSITSSLSSLTNFLGSDSVQGTANLAKSGYELYSGINYLNNANSLMDNSLALSKLQQNYTQAELNALKKYYLPLETTTAQYALEDLKSTRPLQLAQQEYAKDRGIQDIAQAKSLNAMLDPAELGLVSKLTEGQGALSDRMRSQASADISQAFGTTRQNELRNMAAYGVNPNSGAFTDYNQKMATAEALAQANARTSATNAAEDTYINRNAQAMNYRMGIPMSTTSYTPQTSTGSIISSLGDASKVASGLGTTFSNAANAAFAGSQYSFNTAGSHFNNNTTTAKSNLWSN